MDLPSAWKAPNWTFPLMETLVQEGPKVDLPQVNPLSRKAPFRTFPYPGRPPIGPSPSWKPLSRKAPRWTFPKGIPCPRRPLPGPSPILEGPHPSFRYPGRPLPDHSSIVKGPKLALSLIRMSFQSHSSLYCKAIVKLYWIL